MGETSTNIATLNMKQAIKINVREGCEVDNPCDSNPCPQHSYCSDDWDSYSCVCDPGNLVTTPSTHIGAGSHLHALIRSSAAGAAACWQSVHRLILPLPISITLLTLTVAPWKLQSWAKNPGNVSTKQKDSLWPKVLLLCTSPFLFLFFFFLFLSQPFLLLNFSLSLCILIKIL